MSFPYITDIFNAFFHSHLSLPIPTFGLCVAVAIMLASHVARKEVRRQQALGTLPNAAQDALENVIVASILAGLVGARVFSILDYPIQFLHDPMPMIFTRSGLSIYGGLCFGIGTGLFMLKRRAIPLIPMLDATAPAMMLGYAIGRLGCQLSGDGDWGIAANMQLKPEWLPTWLWAQTYQGNIAGINLSPPGVYPTPIYETGMAFAAFGLLWYLRSQKNNPGYLFSMYLLLAGFERLLIEKIRVNIRYHLHGFAFTQAEAISFFLIIAGLIGILMTLRTRSPLTKGLLAIGILTALSACTLH